MKGKRPERMGNKLKGQNEHAHMVTEPEPQPQPQSQHQNEEKNSDDDGYETIYVADLNEYVSYYDWLGDTCATSHVTNQREAFKTFTPFDKREVRGLRNLTVTAEGHGVIHLEAKVNDKTYIVILKDVLYIPSNQQSLIALGRWDTFGGRVKIGNDHLSLLTKKGRLITTGKMLWNDPI